MASSTETINSLAESLKSGYKWKKLHGKERELTFKYIKPYSIGKTTNYSADSESYFTYEQMVRTEQILDKIAKETGLEFHKVDSNQPANITFGNFYKKNDSRYGFTKYSYDSYSNNFINSNVWINTYYNDINANSTLPHEIGHAIGLKHADNYWDTKNTVMGGDYSLTDMTSVDILALQNIYGNDKNNQVIKLLGYADEQIAKVTVNTDRGILSVDVTEQNPHYIFPDKYASVRVKDAQGSTIFEYDIKGKNTELLHREIPITADCQLELYHEETANRLISSDINYPVDTCAKVNIFSITTSGLKNQAPLHQFRLLGYADAQIGTVTVNADSGILSVDVTEQNPHHIFPDKYASVRVKDAQGSTIFECDIKGKNTELLHREIPITADCQLELYHEEPANRLISSDISKPEKINILSMNKLGVKEQNKTIVNDNNEDNTYLYDTSHLIIEDKGGRKNLLNFATVKNTDILMKKNDNDLVFLTQNSLGVKKFLVTVKNHFLSPKNQIERLWVGKNKYNIRKLTAKMTGDLTSDSVAELRNKIRQGEQSARISAVDKVYNKTVLAQVMASLPISEAGSIVHEKKPHQQVHAILNYGLMNNKI